VRRVIKPPGLLKKSELCWQVSANFSVHRI
jgi:hypothetical protein